MLTMEPLEYEIQAKIRELQSLLKYSLAKAPVYLPLIRQIKDEISLCNHALIQLHSKRAKLGNG